MIQPEVTPDRYESGTSNVPGIGGLEAGPDFLLEVGIAEVCAREERLTEDLLEGLGAIRGVQIYGPRVAKGRVAVVSLNIGRRDSAEIGFRLDREYGIATRAGLHCAPEAHRTIGTLGQGTERLSPGFFTTSEEIQVTIRAVSELARE